MSCGAPAVAAAGPRQRKARSGATGTPVPSRTRDPARGSAETARGSWPGGSRGRSLSQVGRIGGRESRWSGESVVGRAGGRESRWSGESVVGRVGGRGGAGESVSAGARDGRTGR